ncbi:uncharacterized protein LY89DRAFT_129660 [Mollisia scopiformis]|uniref:Uncharacterized protein n=1 Tax=Mollisia scopiformis TaxID=149040 RepID=A0A194X4K7_MOLSC|nr:uncharacterized protein LY89DRAFT_129660 [Mollisia scopiformis]KUJ15096.1 hypothetical protein LY89DRAFT_129660 [Mollisia scopiformis]
MHSPTVEKHECVGPSAELEVEVVVAKSLRQQIASHAAEPEQRSSHRHTEILTRSPLQLHHQHHPTLVLHNKSLRNKRVSKRWNCMPAKANPIKASHRFVFGREYVALVSDQWGTTISITTTTTAHDHAPLSPAALLPLLRPPATAPLLCSPLPSPTQLSILRVAPWNLSLSFCRLVLQTVSSSRRLPSCTIVGRVCS